MFQESKKSGNMKTKGELLDHELESKNKETKFSDLAPERQNLVFTEYQNKFDSKLSRAKAEEIFNMDSKEREAYFDKLKNEKTDELKEEADSVIEEVIEEATPNEEQAKHLDEDEEVELGDIRQKAVTSNEELHEDLDKVSSKKEKRAEDVQEQAVKIEKKPEFESLDEFKEFLNKSQADLTVLNKKIFDKEEQKAVNEKNHLLSKAMTEKINADIDKDIEEILKSKEELQSKLDQYEDQMVLIRKIDQYQEQKVVNEKNHYLSKAMAEKINADIDKDIEKTTKDLEGGLSNKEENLSLENIKAEEAPATKEGESVVKPEVEKPVAETNVELAKSPELLAFFGSVKLEDFKSQKSLENLRNKFASIFTQDFLEKLKVDPSVKDGLVNKYFNAMLSKVEEYLEIQFAKQQKEKKSGWFKKEGVKLGKAAWGGALYGLARNLVYKTINIATETAFPLKILASGVTGAAVAGFNDLLGRSWNAATGRKIVKFAKKFGKSGFDSNELFTTVNQDMDILLEFETKSNEVLEGYGADCDDEDIKKLIESTKKIKQQGTEGAQQAIAERQQMIKDLAQNGKLDKFISDQINKELAKLTAEQGEIDDNAKNQLIKKAHLQIERDMNVIIGDVVAQEKFAEVDASGKRFFEKGYMAALLGKAPAETFMQKIWTGFVSGSVAGLFYSTEVGAFIYMTTQRMQGSFRAETLKESKDSTVVKTARQVLENINIVTNKIDGLDETTIRNVIKEARARIKLPDMKEIDRAKIETAIRNLENTFIEQGALTEIREESKGLIGGLSREIISEREAGIKQATELVAEEKKRKRWFGKKGIFKQFRNLDNKTKLKILGKSLVEGVKGGIGAALGSEMVRLGGIAVADGSFSGIDNEQIETSVNAVLDRATFGLASPLGLGMSDRPSDNLSEEKEKDPAAEAGAKFSAEHSLVEGDITHEQNKQNEIITSVTMEIGKDRNYNHLDQALRRIVIDNYNLADTSVDVYDDAKVENIVANLRNDILAGKTDGISFDEKTGVFSIDDYDNLSEDINSRQGHANTVINEKADALAYTDNTSHEIMKDLWKTKILSQNPDTAPEAISIEDASQSEAVKEAEQRVFEIQTKEYFSNLGEEVKFIVGDEEGSGTVEMGDTKLTIDNGKLTALDGVSLESPILLDNKFQENFVVFQIGADYGLDIEDLKQLGIIEKGNFTVTTGEAKALKVLSDSSMFKDNNKDHLKSFKDNFKVTDFIKPDNNIDGKTLSFVANKYLAGDHLDKATLDNLVNNVSAINNVSQGVAELETLYALDGQGVEISVGDKGDIVFNLPAQKNQPPARIAFVDGKVVLPESNNLLANAKTAYKEDLRKIFTAEGLRTAHTNLVEQEMAQNKLLIEAEISGDKDGWFEIPMEKEYLAVALDRLNSDDLDSKEKFVAAMKNYGKEHNMKTFGQTDNFERLYDILDKNIEGDIAGQEKSVSGESVRKFLARTVAVGGSETVLEQSQSSKNYDAELSQDILDENKELASIVTTDKELLDELREDLQELTKEAGESNKGLKEIQAKISNLEDKRTELISKLQQNPANNELHKQIQEVSRQIAETRLYGQGGAKIADNIIQSNIDRLENKIEMIERDIDGDQEQIRVNMEAYIENLDKPMSLDYLGQQNEEKIITEMYDEVLEGELNMGKQQAFTTGIMEVVKGMDKADIAGSKRNFIKSFYDKAEEMNKNDFNGLMKPATKEMLRIVYANLSGDNMGIYQEAYDEIANENQDNNIHQAETIGEFYHLPSDNLDNTEQSAQMILTGKQINKDVISSDLASVPESTPAETQSTAEAPETTPVETTPAAKPEAAPAIPVEEPKEIPKVEVKEAPEVQPETQSATETQVENIPAEQVATISHDSPAVVEKLVSNDEASVEKFVGNANMRGATELGANLQVVAESDDISTEDKIEILKNIKNELVDRMKNDEGSNMTQGRYGDLIQKINSQVRNFENAIQKEGSAPDQVAESKDESQAEDKSQLAPNAAIEAMQNNPLNSTNPDELPQSGTTIINGVNYDMSNPEDRQKVAESNKERQNMVGSSADSFANTDKVTEEPQSKVSPQPEAAPKVQLETQPTVETQTETIPAEQPEKIETNAEQSETQAAQVAADILEDAGVGELNKPLVDFAKIDNYDQLHKILQQQPSNKAIVGGVVFESKDGKLFIQAPDKDRQEIDTTKVDYNRFEEVVNKVIESDKNLKETETNIEQEIENVSDYDNTLDNDNAAIPFDNVNEFMEKANRWGNCPTETKQELANILEHFDKESSDYKYILKEMPRGNARIDMFDQNGKMISSTYTKGNLRI